MVRFVLYSCQGLFKRNKTDRSNVDNRKFYTRDGLRKVGLLGFMASAVNTGSPIVMKMHRPHSNAKPKPSHSVDSSQHLERNDVKQRSNRNVHRA